MAKKTTKKKTTRKKKSVRYSVILHANDQEYKGTGDTVQEALSAMEMTYNKIKTKGQVTAKKDDKSVSKHFNLRQLRHLFANKLVQQQWSRNFTEMLGILESKEDKHKELSII